MINTAVLGFGFMGMTHTLNILKNRRLQLKAIIDKDPGIIDQKLKEQGGNFSTGSLDGRSLEDIRRYASLEDCLANEDIDACFICVHTDLHYPMARKALLAGKHVFLEKPMCLDPDQGEELIRLANEKDLILMPGQVVRFMPAYLELKRIMVTNEYGPLEFLSLSRFAGVPAWGDWAGKQADFGSSGGALFDLVLHDMDFALSVLGNPDSIRCDILPGRLSNHDYVSAVWKYGRDRTTVRVEGGLIFHSSFPFHAGYTAKFEKASLLYHSLQPDLIHIATDKEIRQVWAGPAADGFAGEVEYFAACLEEGTRPVLCTPESALRTIRICYEHLKKCSDEK